MNTKKFLLLIFGLIAVKFSYSQFQFSTGGGVTQYFGELNHGIHFRNAGWSGYLSLEYKLKRWAGFELRGVKTMLRGDDANSKSLEERDRNLDFTSKNTEIGLLVKFRPAQDEWRIQPYLFGGVSTFFFNPRTLLNGKWTALQPMGTEGQHLSGCSDCPDRYHLFKIIYPIGGGMDIVISEQVALSFGMTYRICRTDYLDDVSGNYPNMEMLKGENEDAFLLSWRGDATQIHPYDLSGTARGNPLTKDSFMSIDLGICFKFVKTRDE